MPPRYTRTAAALALSFNRDGRRDPRPKRSTRPVPLHSSRGSRQSSRSHSPTVGQRGYELSEAALSTRQDWRCSRCVLLDGLRRQPHPPRRAMGRERSSALHVRTRRSDLRKQLALGGSLLVFKGNKLGTWTGQPLSRGDRPGPQQQRGYQGSDDSDVVVQITSRVRLRFFEAPSASLSRTRGTLRATAGRRSLPGASRDAAQGQCNDAATRPCCLGVAVSGRVAF